MAAAVGPPCNPIMCQCCGQFQPQQPHPAPDQAWYQPQFQPHHPHAGPPPHHLMMSAGPGPQPPNLAPLCPRAPNAVGKLLISFGSAVSAQFAILLIFGDILNFSRN